MVGKGADKQGSRIFQQCYLKCCKLQNLTPLNCVVPSGNGKILDFCVDRIKYGDWAPILNALSFDLSLHSVAIRCRQQVKTILEQIDCERLAKTVNKRAVILTNFMLSNLMEALAQLLSNTTLLLSLLLEGLPLKIPYLNPLTEALLANNSLQHLSLPRCLIGDAGCLALCKAVRCLPNILSLDLSGCELTVLGASYLAELIKYQKIHRYSENWVHTLRYRLPELDTMAGLRRLSLCANPGLGDNGVGKLLEVLADDLWIRALDVQNCGLSEVSAQTALQTLQSNTKLIVLDMRYNPEISSDSMSMVRAGLRRNETELSPGNGQYSWLGSSSSQERLARHATKNGVVRDKSANPRNGSVKYAKSLPAVKKDKEFSEELLTTQLAEELQHRRQLEELNLQLVQQMQSLRREQMRLWDQRTTSSGSEQSLGTSAASCDLSSTSSGSSRSVPIDQHTLGYIQQAFQDIYAFIKQHQCTGECQQATPKHQDRPHEVSQQPREQQQYSTTEISQCRDLRVTMLPKKAPSAHVKIVEDMKMQKITKSAHLIGNSAATRDLNMNRDMIERQMGDTTNCHVDEQTILEAKKLSSRSFDHISASSSVASGSSTPRGRDPVPSGRDPRTLVTPGQVLSSSEDEDDDDDDADNQESS